MKRDQKQMPLEKQVGYFFIITCKKDKYFDIMKQTSI